ncbi:response regulator transcription factor [Pseudolysinimonas kribbensis]|uniref:DNA-binding response regulator n=1 Tax=Pseudolysinimonas kribbensis TaxID=433641 RepID=A0ABQ6K4F8_9MICO|nr:response regulator transcription factor [Pseudolysinimonas kribbensis]GMA93970.1 DNA-binding response regulator [Pseudolysinimonas kribbensis]
MTRVVIADDQELIRTGFRLILDLEPDVEVVGEAADGEEVLRRVAATHPDVVLMDIRMPGLDGIEATRRIAAAGSSTRVLIMTTFDLDEYVFAALRAGASGFLLKDTPRGQLIDAVHTVARGEALLSPSVTTRLIERFVARADREATGPIAALTARERDVLRAIADGLTNHEIARRLIVSDATVKTHVARILAKLGVRDRVQAVVLAYESGFLRVGSR